MESIKLKKPKSRRRIDIETDSDDNWFLYVKTIENSTEETVHCSMIIRKDLESWISSLESQGWIKQA
jgi:hypothetical protein